MLTLKTLDSQDNETDIPLAGGLYKFKLNFYDDRPSILTFSVLDEQFVLSPQALGPQTRLRLYQDADLLFEGAVTDVDPTDTLEVSVTAIDMSGSFKVIAMSSEWVNSTTPGTTARPRVVYNPQPDDDDYSTANLCKATVGEIIKDILNVNITPLRDHKMVPDAGDPFVQSELDALVVVPQDKVVFTSSTVRNAIETVLRDNYHDKVLHWSPSDRKWHITDLSALTTETVTLNDSTAPVALSGSFNRTVENCATAVRIRGPEGVTEFDLKLSDGGLTDISDVFVPDSAFPSLFGMNKWQITDTAKRRICRRLGAIGYAPSVLSTFGSPCNPQGRWDALYSVTEIETTYSPTVSPTLMVKFARNNAGGDSWQTVEGALFDFRTGVITTGTRYVHRRNPCPPYPGGIAQSKWENPEDVRVYYATPSAPLEVRWPASGFEGTAYTEAGLEFELQVYMEELAVYQANGVNYTTPERLAAVTEIAKATLAALKDIKYAGSLVLGGLDKKWLQPRKLSIASKDGSGQTITTGMESANSRVSEVELDFENNVTTLTWNSGWLEAAGVNPDALKARMKLKALTPVTELLGMAVTREASKVRSGLTGRDIWKFSNSYEYQFRSGFMDEQTGRVEGLRDTSVKSNTAGVEWTALGEVFA